MEKIPLYEYGNILKNEIQIFKIENQFKDLNARDVITWKSSEKKLSCFKSKIELIQKNQSKLYEKFIEKSPHEVIVKFFRLKDRNQCLDEYSKYSKWCSKSSSLPEEMRLNSKYTFKVHQAPDPFEINPEYVFSNLIQNIDMTLSSNLKSALFG